MNPGTSKKDKAAPAPTPAERLAALGVKTVGPGDEADTVTAAPPPRPVRLTTGTALSHGAVTVVNAIATGKGAAIGIDLATTAKVTLRPDDETTAPAAGATSAPRVRFASVRIDGDAEEDTALVETCVRTVLQRFAVDEPVVAEVETRSTIPISRGLKSSSAAANALVLATTAALGQTVGDSADDALDDEAAVRLGVEASLEAGVTITGAYDDATAAYFGGLVATDNPDRAIRYREDVGDLEALLVVPPKKVRTYDTATNPTYPLRPLVEEAWDLVVAGRWREAMLRNSLAYGGAYDISNRLTLSMLDTGAIAAGISGTGPAVAVLVRRDDWDCFIDIVEELAPDAEVLVAHTNTETARIGTEEAPVVLPEVRRVRAPSPTAHGKKREAA